MGLNISVHKVTKYGDEVEFYRLGHREWDSIRHAGDIKFSQQEFNCIPCSKNDPTSDWFLCRPNDFNALSMWVKENISHENDFPRITNMLERMRNDKDLYFYFGY